MRGRSVAMLAKEGHKWQLADMAAALEISTELIAHSQHVQTAALGLPSGLGLGKWHFCRSSRLHMCFLFCNSWALCLEFAPFAIPKYLHPARVFQLPLHFCYQSSYPCTSPCSSLEPPCSKVLSAVFWNVSVMYLPSPTSPAARTLWDLTGQLLSLLLQRGNRKDSSAECAVDSICVI